jgi:hypothetical protein
MGINRPHSGMPSQFPDIGQELLPRKNHAGVRSQMMKEIELGGGEMNLITANMHATPIDVDLNVAEC